MRAMKSLDGYYLYRIDGHLELWRGKIGGENSYRAGYVSNADNLAEAVYAAREEMYWLMKEGI